DSLEAASIYQRQETTARINITTIKGVTVVGDGNVVNADFTDLYRVLNDMKHAVLTDSHLSEDTKLGAVSDIDSLQSQLQKPKPDKGLIKTLWSGIEKVVTGANFAELMAKAARLISPLLS
ncbi:hypothetical protein HKBW3S42_02506, partial [Candidatus Hakubella thermalkaliphila]